MGGALYNEKRTDEVPPVGADEVPVTPSWYEMHWPSLEAAAAEAAMNVPGRFNEQRNAQISVMAAQLALANGRRGDYYQFPMFGEPIATAPTIDETGFYADLKRKRLTDPTFLADAGNSPADFTARLRGEFNADSQRRQREMGKQGWLGNLLGGVAGGFTDPINIATMGIGIEGNIARRIIGEGVLNLGVEVLETPLLMAERTAQGRPQMTGGEILQDWAFAGLGGSAFAGAHIAVGKGAEVAWDAIPLDLRAAAAFRTMKPEEGWTPSERAAMHVIERRGEIEASSPYHDEYQAVGAHVAKMDETLQSLAREPVPTSEVVARPEPPPAPRTARGAGLNPQIVAGLRQRGFTEQQAQGIAAGIHAESRSDPNAEGPMQAHGQYGALGIGQWLGPRRDAIIRQYGPNPTLEQQLDFLAAELRGGDPGGAKVLAQTDPAAIMRSYITDFMRPAAGPQTTGDISRGMQALGRGGETVPEATLANGEPLPDVRPDALDDVRPPVVMTQDGKPMGMGFFKPDEIEVDANLMQFKSGGDEQGVISTLKGVGEWNPVAAGAITVWEGADGRRVVADGHQRLGLAKRLQAAGQGEGITLPAYVLREEDGFSAADARLLTALVNVGQDSGTRIDAAKVFREAGDNPAYLRRMRSEGLAQEGKDLARLSNDAFGAVVNGVIPDSSGAIIGRLAHDPETHMALVDLLAKTKPDNKRQAEAIIAQALDAGFARETQEELFGTRDVATALFAQKAKLLDKTLKELANLKGAFQVAARNADALDAAGNRIDVDASIKAADGNALAQALVSKLAVRKGNPINDIFNDAAARVAAGEPVAKVVRDLVGELRTTDLAGALRNAEKSIEPIDPSGRDLRAELENEAISREPEGLTPSERDELEAAGQGGFALFDEATAKPFDDPAGKGKAETVQSIWHDAEAAAKAEAARLVPRGSADETLALHRDAALHEDAMARASGQGETPKAAEAARFDAIIGVDAAAAARLDIGPIGQQYLDTITNPLTGTFLPDEIPQIISIGQRIAALDGAETVGRRELGEAASYMEPSQHTLQMAGELRGTLDPSDLAREVASDRAHDAVAGVIDRLALKQGKILETDAEEGLFDELQQVALAGGDVDKAAERALKTGRLKAVETGAPELADVKPLEPSTVVPKPAETVKVSDYAGPVIPQAEAAARLDAWKAEARAIGAQGKRDGQVILSLFDASGTWAQPYRDMGFEVYQLDIKAGFDLLRDLPDVLRTVQGFQDGGAKIVGVLAQPPCTTYAGSGARWWGERHDKKWENAVRKMWGGWATKHFGSPVEYNQALVAATEEIIHASNPDFFAIENPVGRIERMTGLPKPLLAIQPHHFGDPYTKRTHLWGKFNTELDTANVLPSEGSRMHKQWSRDEKDEGLRSLTPEGFAYAFALANAPGVERPARLAGAPEPTPAAKIAEAAPAPAMTETVAAPEAAPTKTNITLSGKAENEAAGYTAADVPPMGTTMREQVQRIGQNPTTQETILDAIDRGLIPDGDMLGNGSPRWALESGFADIGPTENGRRGRITDAGKAKLAELRGEVAPPAPVPAPSPAPGSALFDLGDGKGPRALEHIDAELKAQESGIQAARNCLL